MLKKKFGFSSKLRTRDKTQLIKNHFFGLGELFRLRKFDYVFFNNADKRTFEVEGKRFDVFFDAWADRLGQDRSLFIEWARDTHFPMDQTHSKHVISDLVFKYGIMVSSFMTSVSIKNREILEQIKDEFDIELDVEKVLKSEYAKMRFYRWLFRRIKPKVIFLISSFTKVPVVIAAHLEGIKVYEAQHGYIGGNHQFYNSLLDFDQTYYPDYLIGFGNYEKNDIPEDFIFSGSQILPVGSHYLEMIRSEYESVELKSLKQNYDLVFCVTLQGINEPELLNWVMSEVKKHERWLFVLMPRNKSLDYSDYIKDQNCILLPEHNVYQVLKYSDFNITIYSTTAVEAQFFNVKTLFFNYEGLSEKYYDVEDLYAVLINPDETLTQEHLNKEVKPGLREYFIEGYYKNVKETELSI